jgi:hypothetical protein
MDSLRGSRELWIHRDPLGLLHGDANLIRGVGGPWVGERGARREKRCGTDECPPQPISMNDTETSLNIRLERHGSPSFPDQPIWWCMMRQGRSERRKEIMVRPQGLEPRNSESESDVLPLHHGRIPNGSWKEPIQNDCSSRQNQVGCEHFFVIPPFVGSLEGGWERNCSFS